MLLDLNFLVFLMAYADVGQSFMEDSGFFQVIVFLVFLMLALYVVWGMSTKWNKV